MSRIGAVVIGGGRNTEHEVSLASAAAVGRALDPERYDVTALTIGRDGTWTDAEGAALGPGRVLEVVAAADVVLPIVHGRHGEDGELAALCAIAGTPCVGSGVAAGAIGMDKRMTKLVAAAAGVAVAPGVVLDREAAGRHPFRHPVVVKPVSGGSSAGVSLVEEEAALAGAFERAFADDDHVLVEDLVRGREVDLAVLRRADGRLLVGPPLEIEVDGVFDAVSKYDGSAVFTVPAALADAEREALERSAVRMYEALGCAGVARVDFLLTPEGPVLIEVNTMPGLTERSQVPRMFEAIGIGYARLIDLLVEAALAG